MLNFENMVGSIRKNLVVILVILGLVLFLCFILWWTGVLERYEGLEEQAHKQEDLSGKDVYLRYTKTAKSQVAGETVETIDTYYLAISPVKSCDNYKPSFQECDTTMAILQKQKNSFAKFRVLVEGNKYSLFSLHDLSKHLLLNQTLAYTNRSNYSCFENGVDELISFEVEHNNVGKMRLKFTKTEKDKAPVHFYLGLCGNDYNCIQGSNKYPRLCFFTDASKAIYFDFEIAPRDDKEVELTRVQEESSEIEGFDALSNMSMQDMISWDNVTLASNDSIKTIEGLQECTLGMESFCSV